MKKLLLLFVLSVQIACAEKLPLLDQLVALNRNWQDKRLPAALKDSVAEQLDDISLIRLHFKLVEISLGKNRASGLTKQQFQKRQSSIAALHAYAERGVFPKNYHFNHRQPVFIDEHGTYCAVGQLIKESGHDALAQQVHKENNFGYIKVLNQQYTALRTWATDNGFTIDELAWIQPCYGAVCTDSVGIVHPTCHGALNGYFRPKYEGFLSAKSRTLELLVNNNWQPYLNDGCGYYSVPCGLQAGNYRWTIVDSSDIVHYYSASLNAPAPALVSISQFGDFSSCSGTLVVSPSGGAPPYRYFWQNSTLPSKDSSYAGVCEQVIKVIVAEAKNIFCLQTHTVLAGHVGLSERVLNSVSVFPNPTDGQINFASLPAAANIGIYNLTGELIIEYTNCNSEGTVDLRGFSSGLYIYQVKCNEGILSGKLILR